MWYGLLENASRTILKTMPFVLLVAAHKTHHRDVGTDNHQNEYPGLNQAEFDAMTVTMTAECGEDRSTTSAGAQIIAGGQTGGRVAY